MIREAVLPPGPGRALLYPRPSTGLPSCPRHLHEVISRSRQPLVCEDLSLVDKVALIVRSVSSPIPCTPGHATRSGRPRASATKTHT